MNNIIIDSNIVLNVWNHETDPKTDVLLWQSSMILLEKIRMNALTGFLSVTTVMELIHRVRITAATTGGDPAHKIKMALSDINSLGFRQISPDTLTLTGALTYIANQHLDPFDAILLSIAVSEGMDAVISRDEKLRRKASSFIPILTPEEFLSA